MRLKNQSAAVIKNNCVVGILKASKTIIIVVILAEDIDPELIDIKMTVKL